MVFWMVVQKESKTWQHNDEENDTSRLCRHVAFITSILQDIGKVMGILKSSIQAGTADMGIVSKIVKDQLS